MQDRKLLDDYIAARPDILTSVEPGRHVYVRLLEQRGEDLDDIRSVCIVALYTRWPEFDPGKASLNRWAFVVVTTAVVNYCRTNLTRLKHTGSKMPIGSSYQDKEPVEKVDLSGLTEREADAIHKTYWEGKSTAEIAKDWGVSKTSPNRALNRALNKLGRVRKPSDIKSRIDRLRKSGWKMRHICRQLGIGESTYYRHTKCSPNT